MVQREKNSQSRELYDDIPCRGTACRKALSFEESKDDKFRLVWFRGSEAAHEAEELEWTRYRVKEQGSADITRQKNGELHIVFHSGCSSLQPQHCTKIAIFPHLCQ